ncbi:MAG TPA: ABC transporter permease [Anaerolineaceae bacterium]|jgi:ABC-type transport system involved in multi-copper enzyme maturation permease subunit
MNATFILARMTFREAIRRKIVLTALVLGVCFLVVYSIGFHMITADIHNFANRSTQGNPAVTSVASSEGINALTLAGLYAVTFLSIAMAALLGADTLAGEIGSGTIQSIVTKPIRRRDVVLGKWLGFAELLGMYSILMSGGTILSVVVQSGYTPPNFLIGILLIYFESLLIMTLSLMCSSTFSALATGGVVFGLYGMAFIGGWVEQFGSLLQNQTAIDVGIISSLIIPSEALWRRAAYEMQSPISGVLGMSPFGTISVPSTLMVVYAVVYLAGALFLAVKIFQNRDL